MATITTGKASVLGAETAISNIHYWLPPESTKKETSDCGNDVYIDCLCVGTGRFLRSVLVPALSAIGMKTALVQTRGRSFLEFMATNSSSSSYPVDTVHFDGSIQTDFIPCVGAFSLGRAADKQAFYETLLVSPPNGCSRSISIIGVGVTEAGLSSHEMPVMKELFQLLCRLRELRIGGEAEVNTEKPITKICILNTDNVPNNGSVLKQHMQTLATKNGSNGGSGMLDFIEQHLVFLNTMVDRITSARPDDGSPFSKGTAMMIPRAEPVPAKALVILDPTSQLPAAFSIHSKLLREQYGVVVRTEASAFAQDIALKLRVANGTHTAVAHLMALLKLPQTDVLSSSCPTTGPSAESVLMPYLDSLFENQIAVAAADAEAATAVYKDWRQRLIHAHFGLSTFFITQNGASKGGIRLGPTVCDLIQKGQPISVATAMSFAALLLWLTPDCSSTASPIAAIDGVYKGRFDHGVCADDTQTTDYGDEKEPSSSTIEYADKLRYNFDQGWYEFRCACKVSLSSTSTGDGENQKKPLSELLAGLITTTASGKRKRTPQQPVMYAEVIRAYLLAPDGGNLGSVKGKPAFETMVQAVSTLYARAVAGDPLMDLLREMKDKTGPYHQGGFASHCRVLVDGPAAADARISGDGSSNRHTLHYCPYSIPGTSALMQLPVSSETVRSVTFAEVAGAQAIDLHTHLLPPTHGALCLWGIDELLTYHYLVAEYFMTAPASISPESFYSKRKKEQADIIWKSLFLDRSPVSEACRGVLTTLTAFGLEDAVKSRDLQAIRRFYDAYRNEGLAGAQAFSEMIHTKAGVRYNIMTNIPFDAAEAIYWRPECKPYSGNYRSALRVDPLLAGDFKTIELALLSGGYETTLEGARQYLRDWCDTIKPEYMMASTPHDFVLKEGTLADVKQKVGINEEAMLEPGAFAQVAATFNSAAVCDATEDDTPSVINESSDLLRNVLMKICEERDLPLALKIGAHRAVNPALKQAGDGVVGFADASVLARLCQQFPKVRFLATFLSRNNQHEACVLATKFRNLHIYGCWWFCNNPSIIKEITVQRVEMLGTAFTAQHSDARVLDQLLYKWPHSRAVIADVLLEEWAKLLATGWVVTRAEMRRDIQRLLGGSYEEFMAKSLKV